MKTYTTISGDTFDKISFDQLGSEYLVPLLMEVNQKHRDIVVFSSGVVLNIPDVTIEDYQAIPAWLQDATNNGVTVTADTEIVADDSDS